MERNCTCPKAFQRPILAAPLDYPAAGGWSMECPDCNSTVVLSQEQQASAPGDDLAAARGPLLGTATDIPQVAELLRSGKKIEAIKIIRQNFPGQISALRPKRSLKTS